MAENLPSVTQPHQRLRRKVYLYMEYFPLAVSVLAVSCLQGSVNVL